MLVKGFVVAAFIGFTYAAISRGPCKDAKKGGKYEKCKMDCNWDGSCFEAVTLETCDCKNAAVFTTTTYNFKVIFEDFQNLSIQFPILAILHTMSIKLFFYLNSIIHNRMERLQQQLEDVRRDKH